MVVTGREGAFKGMRRANCLKASQREYHAQAREIRGEPSKEEKVEIEFNPVQVADSDGGKE